MATAKTQHSGAYARRAALTSEFLFDAAHHLERYEGKCRNIHGHTYKLIVIVSGYLNQLGMVVDFYDLRAMVQESVIEKLDHHYLNEVLPDLNPTVENLIFWIWEQVAEAIRKNGLHEKGCRLEELHLYETPTASAKLKREWLVDDD